MRIEHMREFIAVAEAGSITAASEQIYVAQPVLSKHLKTLEGQIGGSLLVRTTRGVQLTDLGEEAYHTFKRITEACDRLLDRAEANRMQRSGVLRIGMLNMGVERYIIPTTLEMRRIYPNIEIQYTTAKPNEIAHGLDKGKLDVGFFPDTMRNYSDTLARTLLEREPILIAVSRNHPGAALDALTPEVLSPSPLICLKQPSTTSFMNNLLFEAGIHPAEIIEVDELELAPSLIEEVNGFFALGEFMNGKFTANPNIVTLPMAEPIYEDISFAYREENDNPALALFLDVVQGGRG